MARSHHQSGRCGPVQGCELYLAPWNAEPKLELRYKPRQDIVRTLDGSDLDEI